MGTTYAVRTLELAVVPFRPNAGRSWTASDLAPVDLALAFAPADANNPVLGAQAWVEVCTVPRWLGVPAR